MYGSSHNIDDVDCILGLSEAWSINESRSKIKWEYNKKINKKVNKIKNNGNFLHKRPDIISESSWAILKLIQKYDVK